MVRGPVKPSLDVGMASRTKRRVFYVRHGRSVWNADEAAMRKAGAPEEDIKQRGMQPMYTDSPLSAEGVRQAMSLQELLFAATERPPAKEETDWPVPSLAMQLNCARRGKCLPPRLLTSNLRRAISTLLLALQPALEAPAFVASGVTILPALQETCSHADCSPIARFPNGSLMAPLLSANCSLGRLPSEHWMQADEQDMAQYVLRVEAQQLRDADLGGAASNPFRWLWKMMAKFLPSLSCESLGNEEPHNFLRRAYHELVTLAAHEQVACWLFSTAWSGTLKLDMYHAPSSQP